MRLAVAVSLWGVGGQDAGGDAVFFAFFALRGWRGGAVVVEVSTFREGGGAAAAAVAVLLERDGDGGGFSFGGGSVWVAAPMPSRGAAAAAAVLFWGVGELSRGLAVAGVLHGWRCGWGGGGGPLAAAMSLVVWGGVGGGGALTARAFCTGGRRGGCGVSGSFSKRSALGWLPPLQKRFVAAAAKGAL